MRILRVGRARDARATFMARATIKPGWQADKGQTLEIIRFSKGFRLGAGAQESAKDALNLDPRGVHAKRFQLCIGRT